MIKLNKQRKAFSMLMALFVIVLMSMVASYIFYSSSSIAKEGAIQYKRAQAELLAKSYTEYAILAITGNSRASATQCLQTINANALGGAYTIRVDIKYIGNTKYIGNCPNSSKIVQLANPQANVIPDALSAIIDVYVSYQDSANQNEPAQTYHRRSIQKI
jgi:type II secretory pathway pseudopilin PulG